MGFGNPDVVFDDSGDNATPGGRTHDSGTFYGLSVFFAVIGYGAMAVTAYYFRHWVPTTIWWYLATLLGVLVSMWAGSAWAIASQSWVASLFAYLVLVAGPFGVLFGPIVLVVGSGILFPAVIITAALMVVACFIGLALPAELYTTRFGDVLGIGMLAYLVTSVSLLKASAHHPEVAYWVAIAGIVLFFLLTINDSNRLKSIARKDTDNAVDGGLQLWLNSVNTLLRVITALLTKRN
jgi:hypothetical protein